LKYDLTVIIPTLNEVNTIKGTVLMVLSELERSGINGQVLVVDDYSDDGTIRVVDDLIPWMQGRLDIIVRKENHGLSQSVSEGFGKADSDIIIIMDADGQHPANKVPYLYQKIVEGNDIAIASRYIEGGEAQKSGMFRWVLSSGATFIARVFFPNITDPGSGFFAIRRKVVEGAPLKPVGFRMLFEILGKGNWTKVVEIPYKVRDRIRGESKLHGKTILDHVRQLWDLMKFSVNHPESHVYHEFHRMINFLFVGLTGVFVNLGLLYILTESGMYYVTSGVIAIEMSIISNFFLNDSFVFDDILITENTRAKRFVMYHIVSMVGVIINLASMIIFTEWFGFYYLISSLIGIVVAFSWNFVVNRRYTWQEG
jgi:dolichol-phosphate mannosyltransferase